MDAKVRSDLRRWLKELQEELGITTVLVTHDQEEALEVANRIVVINKGRIEQIGTPEEVFHNPKNEFVINFLGNVNLFHERKDDGSEGTFLIRPHELEIVSKDDNDLIKKAKIKYIQLAGSFVKVELADIKDEKRTILVEMAHYDFNDKKLKKDDIVGIRARNMRSFEDGAGI
ncbi:hypothetical protein ACNSOP_03730 [Aliarcobacter lanthieri]|uniref:hypothetical protein n=1 Tax=Aliarcobacter lanthieri TaxID=1355374 RepID=UPI003AADC89E